MQFPKLLRIFNFTILGLILIEMANAYSQTFQDDKVRLDWQFKEDEPFFLQTTIERKETLETKGKPFTQNSTIQIVSSFKVKEKNATGIGLVQKLEKVTHKAPGSKAETGPSLADKMAGAVFHITLNHQGKIVRFEGYELFLKKVTEGMEDFEKSARALLPEDGMRQMSEEIFHFQPPRPMAKGERWRQDMPFSLGPLGSFKGVHVFTYDGKEPDGERISHTATLIYQAPGSQPAALRITKAQLRADLSSGKILFDSHKGRLIQADFSVTIKGTLTIDFLGQLAEMDLHAEQTTIHRVLAKNPLEK